MRTNLRHLLEERAADSSARPALSHGTVTLDYAGAWEMAWRTGAGLASLGCGGDRVAVYLDKRPQTIATIRWCAAGAVFCRSRPP